MWAPFNLGNILLQNRSIKNMNLKHKYRTARAQLIRTNIFKKTDGAQSFIEKKPIPPKDINSRI